MNAAIEAARMGENGEKFLHAAEEIKNVAQRYEERLKALSEQIDAMEEAQKKSKNRLHRSMKCRRVLHRW